MPALVAWVGIMRWPASSNSNPVSKWSDLLRTIVRWDHREQLTAYAGAGLFLFDLIYIE
jgi:hypothetical protein